MSVSKDNLFFDVDSTGLASNVHAVSWNGSVGEVEYKDPSTNLATYNEEISSFSEYQFAIDAWESAYDAEQAAIALNNAKDAAYSAAYETAYNTAIADGESEEGAFEAGNAAGNAARDAVTSL